MRKAYLLSLLLVSIIGFSQSITVNTSTYTVPQLVTDVLVNSPCSQIRNITWRTGSNFGSSNGIGYFTNTNPSFPLTSGVILSTGNVMNAPGPNTTTLSDGSASWTGDTALETTLAASGITMASKNATVLEFDFTTFTTFFNFKFLFASEEYGTFQCQSPDAFAFLLTDGVAGTTTNLAVVPSTTTPISVKTIRDNLYNSACGSANPSYFGSFNGGSAAAGSATNFNGQTVVLNASSNLVPNRTYHIKLVIADGTDTQFDSAIFLGGSSFQFNQDVLGPDLTVANGTALCTNNGVNQNYTITSGLNPSLFNFAWTLNGNPIGGNTPDLIINQPGTYTLTYSIISTGCVVDTNNIVIEYNASLTTPDPVNLYKCNSGLASYNFDLSFNNSIVNPSNQYTVTYFNSITDAQNNINPLTNILNVASSSLPKTIWVRIQSPIGCFTIKSFILDLTPPPTATNPGTQTQCETTLGSGIAAFDLAALTAGVLGAQNPALYNVSYHFNSADANTNNNPINTSNPIVIANTTIFIRVENKTDTNCFNVISFNLVVKPKPILDVISDKYVCTEYILPPLTNPGQYWSGPNQTGTNYPVGTHITTNQTIYIYNATGGTPSCDNENSFKVFVIGRIDLTPSDIYECDVAAFPAYLYPGMRYFSLPGGPTTPGNVEYIPGVSLLTTLGVTTVYVYYTFIDPSCPPIESQFDIHITKTPTLSNTFVNLFDCTQVSSLPALVTDLGTANYYTFNSSTGIYTPLTLPITTTTHVYAFADNGNCRSTIKDFMVYIGSLGLTNVNACSPPYLLAPAPMGEYRDAPNGGGNIIPPGNINVNTRVYTYIAGATCTNNQFFDITFNQPTLTTPTLAPQCGSFILPINADGGRYFTLQGGPSTTGNIELFAGNTITATTTIYIYKESAVTLTPICYKEVPWTITINPKPTIDSRGDQIVCYNYTLTPLVNGNYYDDPNGQNPITNLFIDASTLNANDDIPNRIKKIYIYAVNPNDNTCFSENSFTITFDGIEAADPGNKTVCNSYTLPILPPNMYYYDASHLGGGGNIIPANTTFTSANVISPVFIYTKTNNRFSCEDENQFTITIINTPVANSVTTQPVCDTYIANNGTYFDGIYQFDLTQYEPQVLGVQSPASNYNFKYFKTQAEALDINATPISTPSQYENTIPFNETVWVRISNANSTNMCFAVTKIDLKVNPLPEPHVGTEYFICEDYASGTVLNSVTIDSGITGSNYSFAWTLNGSPFGGNTSSITTNQAGNYTVTVTNTITNCPNTATTIVTKFSPHIEIVYSDAFTDPNYITVNVLGAGSGNYEYQIDNEHYQDSNVFYNVTSGEHTISVRDKDGHCSPAPVKAVIINYPKFFTPNADGFNDIWNITDLKPTNPNARIFVYDRFGKLIKQISPSTQGWDGMYNGQPLPSTDYWFTVEYDEKGEQKIFKSHFALKR